MQRFTWATGYLVGLVIGVGLWVLFQIPHGGIVSLLIGAVGALTARKIGTRATTK
jgi:hypothetical protein